jgi:hypothetical protein
MLYENLFNQFVGKRLKNIEQLETRKIEERHTTYDHEEITELKLTFEDEDGEESYIQINIGTGGFDIYTMDFLNFDFGGVKYYD